MRGTRNLESGRARDGVPERERERGRQLATVEERAIAIVLRR